MSGRDSGLNGVTVESVDISLAGLRLTGQQNDQEWQ